LWHICKVGLCDSFAFDYCANKARRSESRRKVQGGYGGSATSEQFRRSDNYGRQRASDALDCRNDHAASLIGQDNARYSVKVDFLAAAFAIAAELCECSTRVLRRFCAPHGVAHRKRDRKDSARRPHCCRDGRRK
jgi:hypothetical protein